MSRKFDFLVVVNIFMVVVAVFTDLTNTQLIINVKNQGGDVVQENISASVTDDTVSLEFQRSDGTLVTQLIDFRNEVQVIKALILGEEERGQSQYQVMCFIFHFPKNSFISSDAMSKLRQKNPSTIRIPEEDLGRTNYTMDYNMLLQHSGIISPHIADICSEAKDATFTRHEDIVLWSSAQGIPESSYLAATRKLPHNSVSEHSNEISPNIPSCTGYKKMWSPCECHLEICIGWYPCALKYCKGKSQSKSSNTYRCGIKTCKKCHLFSFYTDQRQQCIWDE